VENQRKERLRGEGVWREKPTEATESSTTGQLTVLGGSTQGFGRTGGGQMRPKMRTGEYKIRRGEKNRIRMAESVTNIVKRVSVARGVILRKGPRQKKGGGEPRPNLGSGGAVPHFRKRF